MTRRHRAAALVAGTAMVVAGFIAATPAKADPPQEVKASGHNPATIVLSRQTWRSGDRITVTEKGVNPGEKVYFGFTWPNGPQPLAGWEATANSSGVASVTVAWPTNDPAGDKLLPGLYDLTATRASIKLTLLPDGQWVIGTRTGSAAPTTTQTGAPSSTQPSSTSPTSSPSSTQPSPTNPTNSPSSTSTATRVVVVSPRTWRAGDRVNVTVTGVPSQQPAYFGLGWPNGHQPLAQWTGTVNSSQVASVTVTWPVNDPAGDKLQPGPYLLFTPGATVKLTLTNDGRWVLGTQTDTGPTNGGGGLPNTGD